MPDMSVLDYLIIYEGMYTLNSESNPDEMKYRILALQRDPYYYIYEMLLKIKIELVKR